MKNRSKSNPIPRSDDFYLVALFLARCSREISTTRHLPPKELKTDRWNEAYMVFFHSVADGRTKEVFYNSMKNARDEFDGHFSNLRKGWSGRKLSNHAQRIFDQFNLVSDTDLWQAVKKLALLTLQSNDQDALFKLIVELENMPDARLPGDSMRSGRFLAGWNDATNNKRSMYSEKSLSRITWQNLGYRVGSEFGDREAGWIETAFGYVCSIWDGQYFAPTDDIEDLQRKSVEYANSADLNNLDYTGPVTPPQRSETTSTSFKRCPRVIAIVLELANGKCELCNESAPFVKPDGSPYLEVHHVVSLANHGLDQIYNAVALCPNCHRRCHHSADTNLSAQELYELVNRLKA